MKQSVLWVFGNRSVRLVLAAVIVAGSIAVLVVERSSVSYLAGLVAAGGIAFFYREYGGRLVETAALSPPLRSVAGADNAHYSDGWTVLLPAEPVGADFPEEGSSSIAARSWLVGRGAYDADTSHIQLAVEGRSRETATITGIHALVERRTEPFEGAAITSPSAGDNQSIELELRLDEAEPQARFQDGRPYFSDYSVSLGRGEIQVFKITARARTSVVQWKLAITFLHRGREQTHVVDVAFRTAPASRAAKRYLWAWYEPPARLTEEPQMRA